ncbi:hypothetical protein MHYP_G00201410 [Metynnis hypsauchen]
MCLIRHCFIIRRCRGGRLGLARFNGWVACRADREDCLSAAKARKPGIAKAKRPMFRAGKRGVLSSGRSLHMSSLLARTGICMQAKDTEYSTNICACLNLPAPHNPLPGLDLCPRPSITNDLDCGPPPEP